MFYFIIYLAITLLLCTILYRQIEVNPKKYKDWSDEDALFILYLGRVFWPISIPCYIVFLVGKFFFKKTYVLVSKFIK